MIKIKSTPKYKSLFPYNNRSLGMDSFTTPKEENRNAKCLIKILISNLVAGDEIQFPKASVTILSVRNESISYNAKIFSGETLSNVDKVDDLEEGILFTAFENLYESSLEGFVSKFYKIIEKDPAIFRLQSGLGWVINDELCLSTGNVSYKDIESKVEETPLSPPTTIAEPVKETQQSAFDF